MSNGQRFFAVLLDGVPDDWRKARGMSRNRHVAELMAKRYRGARVVEVFIGLAGQMIMVVAEGDFKRKPIEKKRRPK